MQYEDVFAGLQYITEKTSIPWKIFYRNGDTFLFITLKMLDAVTQKKIKEWAKGYRN